jgi:glycosyltransferase involved in cell wall biosynthesis
VTAPRISVIVPHYNDPARLLLCLAALEGQSLPRAQYEIIVADNASPQGEKVLAELIAGRATLVIVPEKGAGPARNGGVAKARGKILAFTDSDCIPDPRWLEAGIAALERFDIIGGRMNILLDHDGPITPAEAFEAVFAFDNAGYVRTKGFTVTANLFCRRADFHRVGPFRSDMSEDKEWCHRATAMGLKLGYAKDAIVAHPPRRSWEDLRTKFARIDRETFAWTIATKKNGRIKWLLRSFALPLSILPHSLKVMTSPRLSRPADRLGALAVLVRQRLWRCTHAWRLLFTQGRP